MYVNQAMTTSVKTCQLQTNLDDAARLMWEGDCGAIPVVNEDHKPLGIVTDRDIAMAAMLNHQPLWDIPVATVIQPQQPYCCSQQDTVETALGIMEKNGVRRLLVTDEGGSLAGILSMGDALALTQGLDGGRNKPAVSIEQMLGMLRKVSSHHKSPELPVQHIN